MVGLDRREQMRAFLARREQRGRAFQELSTEAGVPSGTLACWAWMLSQEEREPARHRPPAAGPFIEFLAASGPAEFLAHSPCLEVVLARVNRRCVTIDVPQLRKRWRPLTDPRTLRVSGSPQGRFRRGGGLVPCVSAGDGLRLQLSPQP